MNFLASGAINSILRFKVGSMIRVDPRGKLKNPRIYDPSGSGIRIHKVRFWYIFFLTMAAILFYLSHFKGECEQLNHLVPNLGSRIRVGSMIRVDPRGKSDL